MDMLGNQGRLPQGFIVLAESLNVLSNGFSDAGTATFPHTFCQLIQLLFEFRLDTNTNGHGYKRSTICLTA